MKTPYDLQFPQNNNTPTNQQKPRHLQLVVSNPVPNSFGKRVSQKIWDRTQGFSATIQKEQHPHYTLVATDPFNRLECTIKLEVHDNPDDHEWEPGTVSFHFPMIETEGMDELIDEDELLHGTILMLFQMNILEKILYFARKHNAQRLVAETENMREGHILKAYEYLATRVNNIPTARRGKKQLLIPTHNQVFTALKDFRESITQGLRETLWEAQRVNLVIQDYLKMALQMKFLG